MRLSPQARIVLIVLWAVASLLLSMTVHLRFSVIFFNYHSIGKFLLWVLTFFTPLLVLFAFTRGKQ